MAEVDFSGWDWGESEHDLWGKANRNGAQVAIREVMSKPPFVTMDPDGDDVLVTILLGPFVVKFKKSDLRADGDSFAGDANVETISWRW